MGPIFGAGVIKYLENIFSKINENVLDGWFAFLPDSLREPVVWFLSRFTGEGWALTLGLMFMLVVIFLPGGLMEGADRLKALFTRKKNTGDDAAGETPPAE